MSTSTGVFSHLNILVVAGVGDLRYSEEKKLVEFIEENGGKVVAR